MMYMMMMMMTWMSHEKYCVMLNILYKFYFYYFLMSIFVISDDLVLQKIKVLFAVDVAVQAIKEELQMCRIFLINFFLTFPMLIERFMSKTILETNFFHLMYKP